jgi:hypothetical protein
VPESSTSQADSRRRPVYTVYIRIKSIFCLIDKKVYGVKIIFLFRNEILPGREEKREKR